jgi:hypothetical protein
VNVYLRPLVTGVLAILHLAISLLLAMDVEMDLVVFGVMIPELAKVKENPVAKLPILLATNTAKLKE